MTSKWTSTYCFQRTLVVLIFGVSVSVILYYNGYWNQISDFHIYKQNKRTKFENHTDNAKSRITTLHRLKPRLKNGTNTLTPVSISTLFKRFEHKTLASCDNTCTFHPLVCKASEPLTWVSVMKSGFVKCQELFSQHEYVYEWEKDYLSHQPLLDFSLLPDVHKSRVFPLVSGVTNWQQNIAGQMGRRLDFRLDLVNHYGLRRRYGGDEVRSWLSEHPDTTPRQNYYAAGMVTDLKNGSYLVSVTPVWSGMIQLNIALVYPREYIRMALDHMRKGSHRFMLGKFTHGNISEGTVCGPTPNVPGRPCVCNLTDVNNGQSLFCGRPLDNRLSCKDWSHFCSTSQVPLKDFTPAENELASVMSSPMESSQSLIKHGIRINVTAQVKDKETPVPLCSRNNSSRSWVKESPRGFWTKQQTWRSLECQERARSLDSIRKCLSNHTVLIIGDSNSKKIFDSVQGFVAGEMQRQERVQISYNKQWNITVRQQMHDYPYFRDSTWASVSLHSPTQTLDKIPWNGNHVVIVHYFLHFSPFHLSELYLRLTALRQSLSALVKRNRRVLIGLRGPHITTVELIYNHMFGGDVQASFITRMYKDIFKDLRQHVVYLDGWDMSIGLQNRRLHPPLTFTDAMFRTLLSYKCH